MNFSNFSIINVIINCNCFKIIFIITMAKKQIEIGVNQLEGVSGL